MTTNSADTADTAIAKIVIAIKIQLLYMLVFISA